MHCRLVSMCPTMDLVASLHADGQLSVYRYPVARLIVVRATNEMDRASRDVVYISLIGSGITNLGVVQDREISCL